MKTFFVKGSPFGAVGIYGNVSENFSVGMLVNMVNLHTGRSYARRIQRIFYQGNDVCYIDF